MDEASDHVELILPPPLIFLGHLLSALILQWVVPLPLPWPAPLRVPGAVLLLGGFALAAAAVREMRKMHTTPDPKQPVTILVTTGPYRFSRNPIYLGFLLIFVGFTLLTGTLWGVLLSPFLIGTITRSVIRPEENYLQGRFDGQYSIYRTLVRRWF